MQELRRRAVMDERMIHAGPLPACARTKLGDAFMSGNLAYG
jgi:hypothetical protein